MSEEDVTNKIKSRGYWRVEIRPTSFEKLRIRTFSQARELVQSCIVLWRGWDYPHWNARTVRNMHDWVESWEDWEHEIEYWRFYRSGQFVHLFALREAYRNILPKRYPPRPPRTGYVSFLSTTYQVTEILEFAARLANKGILRPSAFISIGLHNIKDHELASFSASRFLPDGYVYTTDDPIIIEEEVPQQKLATNPDDLALNFITEIFERFNWDNPPRNMLAEDQKRLRERRL